MRDIITHFSHSTNSTTHLKALRVILTINHGLVKIGKTRFGTIYWAGYALLGCLPAIYELITTDIISPDGLAWFKQLVVYQTFELQLKQLVMILEPIARAIKCLEGLGVTVSDVWQFYVAITAVLRDLFEADVLSFPPSLRDAVSSIINRRFDQMINGPSGDLYLSGFYLDPGELLSCIIVLALTLCQSTSKVQSCCARQLINLRRRPYLGPNRRLCLRGPRTRISVIPCPRTQRLVFFS